MMIQISLESLTEMTKEITHLRRQVSELQARCNDYVTETRAQRVTIAELGVQCTDAQAEATLLQEQVRELARSVRRERNRDGGSE